MKLLALSFEPYQVLEGTFPQLRIADGKSPFQPSNLLVELRQGKLHNFFLCMCNGRTLAHLLPWSYI